MSHDSCWSAVFSVAASLESFAAFTAGRAFFIGVGRLCPWLFKFLLEETDMSKPVGTIPDNTWLRKNGFDGLRQAMRKHPGLFKHLKQEPTKRKKKEVRA